jgi:hypothetical protein
VCSRSGPPAPPVLLLSADYPLSLCCFIRYHCHWVLSVSYAVKSPVFIQITGSSICTTVGHHCYGPC